MMIKKHSDETKLKISLSKIGSKNPMYGKKGVLSPRYGIYHTKESKEKISLSKKRNPFFITKEYREKLRIARRNRKVSPHSEATKRKMSISRKGKCLSILTRAKMSKSLINRWKNLDYRKKQIELCTKRWKNNIYRENQIKSILKGLFEIRPTSLEKQMIDIIKKYELPYKYTGDGSFLIGYKNPDFVNINGQKRCIEVANIFHHKKDYEQKRIEHFAKYGWKCYVFKMDNLYNDLSNIIKIMRE